MIVLPASLAGKDPLPASLAGKRRCIQRNYIFLSVSLSGFCIDIYRLCGHPKIF